MIQHCVRTRANTTTWVPVLIAALKRTKPALGFNVSNLMTSAWR
jgi:hypothetical protein